MVTLLVRARRFPHYPTTSGTILWQIFQNTCLLNLCRIKHLEITQPYQPLRAKYSDKSEEFLECTNHNRATTENIMQLTHVLQANMERKHSQAHCGQSTKDECLLSTGTGVQFLSPSTRTTKAAGKIPHMRQAKGDQRKVRKNMRTIKRTAWTFL